MENTNSTISTSFIARHGVTKNTLISYCEKCCYQILSDLSESLMCKSIYYSDTGKYPCYTDSPQSHLGLHYDSIFLDLKQFQYTCSLSNDSRRKVIRHIHRDLKKWKLFVPQNLTFLVK